MSPRLSSKADKIITDQTESRKEHKTYGVLALVSSKQSFRPSRPSSSHNLATPNTKRWKYEQLAQYQGQVTHKITRNIHKKKRTSHHLAKRKLECRTWSSSAVEHNVLHVVLDLRKLTHLHRPLPGYCLPAAARGWATVWAFSFHIVACTECGKVGVVG